MIKAAVIGVGRMGRKHGKAIKAAGLDLCGVADGLEASLQAARDELSLPPGQCFQDPIEMIRTVKPDFLCVATTATSHAELTCQAAEMGVRHILCEKPMATSVADCERMIATCEKHGVTFGVNHQMRFISQYMRPKEVVESEALGGFCGLHVIAGNCGLAMNGTHFVELMRLMAGPAEEITAWFSPDITPNPRGPEFEDRAGFIRVRTSTGKRLHVEATSDQGHGLLLCYSGRNGQVIVDMLTGWMRVNCRKEEHRAKPTTLYGLPWDSWEEKLVMTDVETATRKVIEHMLAGSGYPNGQDAMHSVKTLVAAHASAALGGMPVPLEQPAWHDHRFPWA
jgi:predicted dehydrogenase